MQVLLVELDKKSVTILGGPSISTVLTALPPFLAQITFLVLTATLN